MSATDRAALVIEGAPNFRDLGGIAVAGGHVAPGRLYRSEGLADLTDEGVAALGRLGVQLVCDLRTPHERDRHPSRWPEEARPELLGATGGVDLRALSRDRVAEIYEDPGGGRAQRFMRGMYGEMMEVYAELLAELAARIADDRELPVVIHCAAGKDRTGFVCSVLLLALGASAEDIHADYILSDEHFGADRMRLIIAERMRAEPPVDVVTAFRANRDYLQVALDAIEARYGSVDGYLQRVGLDAARRERLRDALVE